MYLIKDLRNKWSELLPASKNITTNISLRWPKLLVNKGFISTLKFDSKKNVSEFNPSNVKYKLKKLTKNIHKTLAKSKNVIRSSQIMSLSGNIKINNGYFHELYADNVIVNYLNNQTLDLSKTLVSTDQKFSVPLKVENIYLENLQVPSLCGIPSQSKNLF